MMMMIPEPWQHHETMSDEKKAFYEFHRFLMEPWDGPASISFTDGIRIGAVLDRNGLRPSRYYVTKDDILVLASEVGVLDFPAENIQSKGRLQPGRMLLVDTEEGRIVADEEIKQQIATREALPRMAEQARGPRGRPAGSAAIARPRPRTTLVQQQRAFGYTFEDERFILMPMATDGVEPLGSMGTDTPAGGALEQAAAALQLFQAALRPGHQPADRLPARGDHHLHRNRAGRGGQPARAHARELPVPEVRNADPAQRGTGADQGNISSPGFKSAVLPILFKAAEGGAGLEQALEELYAQGRQGDRRRRQHPDPVRPRH